MKKHFYSLLMGGLLIWASGVSANNDLIAQDGDIIDEDVATLDYPMSLGARNSDFSFSRSKYTLAKEVYNDYKEAFYSACRFRKYDNKLVRVKSSCGFKYRKNEKRAARIEWEHIVPAWVFGHQLQCWQDGGRAKCRDSNKQFRQMEADMHNLVPAIGEINGDRSNFGFGMIDGEARPYGKPINMEVDFSNRRAEPREEVWGDIARTYFYMRDKYGFRLSSEDEKLYAAWNNGDPVDAWEKKRNERISKLQSNDNPYVSEYRQVTPQKGSVNTGDYSDTTVASGDGLVDKLYQWVMGSKDDLPYPLVLLVMVAYFIYRKFFQKK